MAARAVVLDEDLNYRLQTAAAEIVEEFGIDGNRTGELMEKLMAIKNEVLDNYANPQEYEVTIKAA